MCVLLDVIHAGCTYIFVFLSFVSAGQCLIFVLIVYCFVLGLEPSYLDKRERYYGNSLSHRLLGTGLLGHDLSTDKCR